MAYKRRTRRTRRGSSDDGGNIFGQIAGAPLGLAGNLFGDVKDAVVGMPMGLVSLATDPGESIRAMVGATWHTWSPLFAGDFHKFGKGIYDHPLAPILDVVSVFTLGAGSVARGASGLAKAGSTSTKVAKVAGMRGVKKPVTLKDPTGKRPDLEWHPSQRAGRYAMQQARMALEGVMPDLYMRPLSRMRYEKANTRRMGGNVVGKSLVLGQIMEAGKRLTDDTTAPFERQKLLTGNHLGLIRHATYLDPAEAAKYVKAGHYAYARDIRYANGDYLKQIQNLERLETKWHGRREKVAELSHAVPRIEQELLQASQRLSKMSTHGYRVAMPASKRAKPTEKQILAQRMAPIREQEKIIADLDKRLLAARVAKGKHDDAIAHIDNYRTQRADIEERGTSAVYTHAAVSDEAFMAAARNLGRSATTRNEAWAARTAEGKVGIVPKHDAYNLGLEMESSHKFVKYAYHKPTQLWKMAMIGWTPRAITNNFVGNWTLYALREGPSHEAAAALHDAIRWQHGSRRAGEIFDEAFVRNDVITREFADVVGNVFSAELREELKGSSRLMQKAGQGVYPIVHATADKPVRVASLYRFFRDLPEVRAAMRNGKSIDEAITQAIKEKPYLRNAAADHVNKTAGDYVALTTAEKHIRQVVPFYLWYRHIARTTGNMVLDTPARAAVLQRLSGLGIERTEELLGEIPEFLNGAVPLSAIGLGKGGGSRADALLTQSLNPFASIGEIASLVEAFTIGGGARGASAAAIGINPFITGGVEAMTGTSLLSGAPKKGFGGIIPSVLKATSESLPQVKLLDALRKEDVTESPSGYEYLYAKDDRSPITSLFGIPIRDISKESAESLAQLERDKPNPGAGSPRKRKRRR